jgi:radical SAM PhpK family P-methyltransferase
MNSLQENIPDYSLFPKEEIGEFLSIRTSTSCPFDCAYCGYSQRAGKYRYLEPVFIEKELNAIRELECVSTLTFIDDTFNVPKKRFKEILRMMIKNNYGFKWNSYYRCDQGDEETIELMKEAGCEGVFLGIESGSDVMLKRMNKTARRKDYLKAIPLLKEAGIITHANLIMGFPGETEVTVQETLNLLEETAPNFFRAQLWYADPITPIWDKREEYGIEGSAFNWSHNTMDYHTACKLIDEKFFPLECSIWLPQYGFELWSVFYLQRRGMTLDQVKAFITSFNAIVQEKLLYSDKSFTSSERLNELKQRCQFDTFIESAKGEIPPATPEELEMLEMLSNHE